MHTLLFASFQICTDVTNYFPLATRGMGWGGATVLDLITHVLLRCGTLVMTCTCIRCYARKARWGFQVTARQMRAFFAKHDLKNMRFCKSSKAERYIMVHKSDAGHIAGPWWTLRASYSEVMELFFKHLEADKHPKCVCVKIQSYPSKGEKVSSNKSNHKSRWKHNFRHMRIKYQEVRKPNWELKMTIDGPARATSLHAASFCMPHSAVLLCSTMFLLRRS